MRAMDLDPTFAPYVREAAAARSVPLHLADIAARRSEVAAARASESAGAPAGILVEWKELALPHRSMRALVFRPEGKTGLPGILYCHGGGWMYGNPAQSQELAFRYVTDVGAVVVSPEYRLTPEHPYPAALEDCYATLQWMQARGDEIGIDSARLAGAGESAGGTLIAACALRARDTNGPRLRLQVLNYPALGTDFHTGSYRENADAPILSRDEMMYFWRNYLGSEDRANDPLAVPLAGQNFAGLPPAHIIVAEYDPLRDDGIRFAEKLKAARVPVELVRAQRLTHGFFRALTVSDDVKELVGEICGALRRALRR